MSCFFKGRRHKLKLEKTNKENFHNIGSLALLLIHAVEHNVIAATPTHLFCLFTKHNRV